MKSKHAEKHLKLILDTQQSVSTSKIKKMIMTITGENKMLRADNKNLRKKIKKLRGK